MKVYIIGTGMEGEKTLTKEAENAINEAQLLIGAERMLKPFIKNEKEYFYSYDPVEIKDKINSCNYKSAAVLMSGDCSFFSGSKKLLPILEQHDITLIAGISSVSYFCSRLGITYEKMKFVTLHGRDSNIAINVKMNERCFFLLGGNYGIADVCKRLCSYGMSGTTVHFGTDLGYQNEKIVTGKASDFTGISDRGLAVMITENTDYLNFTPTAVNDELFQRSEIPMTKAEVRCIAISKLEIGTDSVVWDIGCGTGSVSVEAAYKCPDGKVISFDKKTQAAALTAENAKLFNCDNIKVIEGECPEALESAETPDKVFIGGSSGNMESIFQTIHSKNPHADVVVTAVSLETLHESVNCFERHGKYPEIVQIAVSRTKKIASHTMLQGMNPVFIISGRLI